MTPKHRLRTTLLLGVLAVFLIVPSSALPPPAGGPAHTPTSAAPHTGSALAHGLRSGGRTPASAAPSPQAPSLRWLNITNESTAPLPPTWFTEGTWDAADGYLLYYGGDNTQSTTYASTWSYSAGQWTNQSGASGPPVETGPALAYDPSAGSVVMIGGYSNTAPFTYNASTWLYSGGSWSFQATNASVPPRTAAAMTYDPDLGGVLLFGGYDNRDPNGSVDLNDTWLFAGGSWRAVATNVGPSTRAWPTAAYDPGRHELVLYSGTPDSATSCLGDTWTLSGTVSASTWTLHPAGAGGPPALCGASLVYDPQLAQVVLMGGLFYSGGRSYYSEATYAFNGTAWTPLSLTGHPDPHFYGVTAWDPTENAIVLADGAGGLGVTDLLTGPLTFDNVTGPGTVEVGQPASFHANLTGGSPQRSYRWNWGDLNGSTTGGPTGIHVYTVAGSYTVNVTGTDATGAQVSGDTTIDVTAGPVPAFAPVPPAQWDVGYPLSFAGTSSGGMGGDRLSWSFGDGITAVGSSASHTYRTTGTFSVELSVRDRVGGVGNVEASVQIVAAPAAHIFAAAIADTQLAYVANATAYGGIAPYTYFWNFGDGGTAGSRLARHVYAIAGAYTVNLTAFDSINDSASTTTTLHVAPFPTLEINAPTAVVAGDAASFTPGPSGGQGPYSYLWQLPNGTTSASPELNITFAAAGAYTLHLRLTDAAGAEVNASLSVTVTPQPNSSSPALGTYGLVLVALVVVVVAGAVAALLISRRRKRREPEEPREP